MVNARDAARTRVEFNPAAFPKIRHLYRAEISEIGQEVAEYANRAAEEHDVGGRTAGDNSYNSQDFGGPERPRTYVRVADSRGLIDEALHGTLIESLYSVKGRRIT